MRGWDSARRQGRREKIGTLRACSTAALAGLAAVWFGVQSSARAGELQPPSDPGVPAPTRPEIPTDWSRRLDSTTGTPCASERFRCLWPISDPALSDGSVVLDRETGLVWLRQDSAPGNGKYEAMAEHCAEFAFDVGQRKGFRVPTAAEMGSLIDMTGSPAKLPAGHPFQITEPNGIFVTSTPSKSPTATDGSFLAYNLSTGMVDRELETSFPMRVMCVRGPE